LDATYIKAESATTADAIACVARLLVMVTLPHSKPTGPIYERRNGDLIFRVIAPHGIPYGAKPRLIAHWLSSEIVKTRAREIELGGSLSEFLRKLGIEKTGREIRAVKDQTRRLFASAIQVERKQKSQWTILHMNVAAAADILWDPKLPDQEGLWGSTVKVGEAFYDECLRSPIPLDERALRALKGSSFDLDIYGWAAARLFTVKKPTLIPWTLLQGQFGAGYPATGRGLRNFKKAFGQRLNRVLQVYPGAKMWMDDAGRGLWLDKSPPAVHKRLFHIPR